MFLLKTAFLKRVLPSVIFLSFSLIACNNQADERNKLIVKKWTYKEFKMNDEIMPGELFENPFMEFYADGRYAFEFGPMADEGQWRIVGDDLETTSDGEEPKRMKIEELTETKLVLFSIEDGNRAYLTLEPAVTEN